MPEPIRVGDWLAMTREERAELGEPADGAATRIQALAALVRSSSSLRPCLWPRCPRKIPERYLMCRPHWHAVPYEIRRRILDTYRPGQTILTASPEYLEALNDALAAAEAR